MKATAKEQVLTNGLRETLKAIMQKEIEMLPELFEKIDPKDRINLLCKLMPFVFPKVDTVHPNEGEPNEW